MSKKDYAILAAALKVALDATEGTPEHEGVVKAVYAVSNVLGEDNPRFDGHRFLRAAGLTDEERHA